MPWLHYGLTGEMGYQDGSMLLFKYKQTNNSPLWHPSHFFECPGFFVSFLCMETDVQMSLRANWQKKAEHSQLNSNASIPAISPQTMVLATIRGKVIRFMRPVLPLHGQPSHEILSLPLNTHPHELLGKTLKSQLRIIQVNRVNVIGNKSQECEMRICLKCRENGALEIRGSESPCWCAAPALKAHLAAACCAMLCRGKNTHTHTQETQHWKQARPTADVPIGPEYACFLTNSNTHSALKPLTCRILICLTIVLFPDSPAPWK